MPESLRKKKKKKKTEIGDKISKEEVKCLRFWCDDEEINSVPLVRFLLVWGGGVAGGVLWGHWRITLTISKTVCRRPRKRSRLGAEAVGVEAVSLSGELTTMGETNNHQLQQLRCWLTDNKRKNNYVWRSFPGRNFYFPSPWDYQCQLWLLV